MLVAQITDMHIKPDGVLAYKRVDTAAFLARTVDHILHLDTLPDVVLGTGEADIPRIVSKLRAQGYTGPLVIEREAGNQRLTDIREAIRLLKSLVG